MISCITLVYISTPVLTAMQITGPCGNYADIFNDNRLSKQFSNLNNPTELKINGRSPKTNNQSEGGRGGEGKR